MISVHASMPKYSPEIYELLKQAGGHRNRPSGSRANWLLCFQRKWLLRPLWAGRCLWAYVHDRDGRSWWHKVRSLLGIRVFRLYSEGPLPWAWARVRDKEQKKVSCFDPVGKR